MRQPAAPTPRASARYLSGAVLDSTTLCLEAEVADLRKTLAVHPRLALSPLPASRRGKHPLVVDLFRVSEGRVEAGPTDQHGLATMAGGALGVWTGAGMGGAMGSVQGALAGSTMGSYVGDWLGPMGSLLGAATGFMSGSALGALAGLGPGASKGVRVGVVTAARASRRLSDTIGTYDEVLIGVPDVVVRGDGDRRYFFVVGMYTNSAIARWGDRAFSFGYRKRAATILNEPFRRFRVDLGGRRVFSADFAAVEPDAWRPSLGAAEQGTLELFAQPLLGITERGGLARSRLDRSFDDPSVRFAISGGATVRLGPGFATGVSARKYPPRPLGPAQPWSVLHARSVMSRVSFPAALKEASARPSRAHR